MSNWQRSSVTLTQLQGLVAAGMLPPQTEAEEWCVPGLEDYPTPKPGYVVSFVAFHEWGFSVPTGRFIWAVLAEYGMEL